MRKILMPLIAVVLAAVILLGLYNGLASERVVYEMHDLQEKMEAMLPGSKTFTPEEYTGEDSNIHRVWKGETGYIVETITYGYAGNITMLVGVSFDGKVLGIAVVSQTETAGLGAVVAADNQAGQTFRDQFVGLSGPLAVTKDGGGIDAITGATITSRAVVEGVNAALACIADLEQAE